MGPPSFNQMFSPAPTFTETDVDDQTGKVVIVTGSTSGVGYELAKILYGAGARVYIAARSTDKITEAIKNIKADIPSSSGKLSALTFDLADLSSIKQSAHNFLNAEGTLDVLVHNAGVMTPPVGSKTKLGHDLEMGTNCLGPFLFNHFLEGVMKNTAATAPANSVRIVWVASMVAVATPQGGVLWSEETGQPKVLKNAMESYMETKAGNMFLASEYAKRSRKDGVISLSVNPGLLKTELQRHSAAGAVQNFISGFILQPAKFGAYSELFAGWSPKITAKQNGSFVVPFGRLGPIPEHIERGMKSKSDGGTGNAERFWNWCESETREYV